MDDSMPAWLDSRFQTALDTIVLDHRWPGDPPPDEDWGVREVGAWEFPASRRPVDRRRLLVSVREAARMLDCGRSLVYDFIRTGQLPIVKLGRLTRIPVEALQEFAARKVVEGQTSRGEWEDLDP
jgi:excisionase family DNA binding protein